MKEEIVIKIRKNVLKEILSKISIKDQKEFDEIIEDSLIQQFKIRLTDIESPINFEDGVIKDLGDVNHGYYVYVFMDPIIKCKIKTDIENISFNYQPFYIGKGIGKRIDESERNDGVNSRIEYLKSRGVDPIIIKIKEGLSNFEACKIETYLIEKIGRSDLGKGPLLNISAGIKFKNTDDVIMSFSNLNLEKNINSMILDAINKSKTLKEAAKKLGISERTLYRKLNDLDIIYEDTGYVFRKKAD